MHHVSAVQLLQAAAAVLQQLQALKHLLVRLWLVLPLGSNSSKRAAVTVLLGGGPNTSSNSSSRRGRED